jgi:hypothetical protein
MPRHLRSRFLGVPSSSRRLVILLVKPGQRCYHRVAQERDGQQRRSTLSIPRTPSRGHYGLTEALAQCFAEGAAVCMQAHHTSPKTVSVSADDDTRQEFVIWWPIPSGRQLAAWNNNSDAVRDAAYAIAIAAAEVYRGLFVVARAPQGSGADYIVSARRYDPDSDDGLDPEDDVLIRLEVKGRSYCDGERQLDTLAREAVEQLHYGNSDLPWLGGAVAFNLAQIRFRRT